MRGRQVPVKVDGLSQETIQKCLERFRARGWEVEPKPISALVNNQRAELSVSGVVQTTETVVIFDYNTGEDDDLHGYVAYTEDASGEWTLFPTGMVYPMRLEAMAGEDGFFFIPVAEILALLAADIIKRYEAGAS